MLILVIYLINYAVSEVFNERQAVWTNTFFLSNFASGWRWMNNPVSRSIFPSYDIAFRLLNISMEILS